MTERRVSTAGQTRGGKGRRSLHGRHTIDLVKVRAPSIWARESDDTRVQDCGRPDRAGDERGRSNTLGHSWGFSRGGVRGLECSSLLDTFRVSGELHEGATVPSLLTEVPPVGTVMPSLVAETLPNGFAGLSLLVVSSAVADTSVADDSVEVPEAEIIGGRVEGQPPVSEAPVMSRGRTGEQGYRPHPDRRDTPGTALSRWLPRRHTNLGRSYPAASAPLVRRSSNTASVTSPNTLATAV